MKRTLLLSLVSMFVCSVSSFAQNTLNIHQKDGTIVTYGFSEKPVVTYTETGIHLSTTSVEVDYPMTALEKFTFSNGNQSGIGDVTTEGTDGDVRIYNTNGVLLKTIRQNEGIATFSTSDLPKGIYIIKNGKITYKITKR